MNTGVNSSMNVIEELNSRVRQLEERVESYLGFNWEALRPAQFAGCDLPTDEGEVRRLATELKAKRPEMTDVKKLHMVDMLLHFFSLWPVLPNASRRYAYNMGTLLNVAVTEGWNEATQRSNGFSPQLVTPVSNGHEATVPRSSITAQVSGIQAIPVAGTSVARTSGTQALLPTTIASPPRLDARSPSGTPVKREAPDEAVGATSPKVATNGPTSSIQSPNVQTASPLSYKPKCGCKQPAFRLQVKKDNQNKGRYFYKCYKSSILNPTSPCEYFEWEDKLPLKAPKNCSHCGKPGHNKNSCPAK